MAEIIIAGRLYFVISPYVPVFSGFEICCLGPVLAPFGIEGI
jgi:hypothetical protein